MFEKAKSFLKQCLLNSFSVLHSEANDTENRKPLVIWLNEKQVIYMEKGVITLPKNQ